MYKHILRIFLYLEYFVCILGVCKDKKDWCEDIELRRCDDVLKEACPKTCKACKG